MTVVLLNIVTVLVDTAIYAATSDREIIRDVKETLCSMVLGPLCGSFTMYDDSSIHTSGSYEHTTGFQLKGHAVTLADHGN